MTPLCTLPLWPFPIKQNRAFSKFEIFILYNPDGFFCKIVLANDNLNKFFAFFDLISFIVRHWVIVLFYQEINSCLYRMHCYLGLIYELTYFLI